MDDKFLNLGFHEYKPDLIFDGKDVEKCFQKRYDDNNGKKYFINIKKWKGLIHPYTNEVFPPDYEYHVQLYKKDGHDPIDLIFHSSWNLIDVEKYLEKLWDTGLFAYYEDFLES